MLVWKLSLPSQAAIHPHRIFFCALHALAVDDRGGRARLARGGLAALRIKRVVDAIERAVPAPQVEIIVERRARRQVLGDRPPLTPGAQDLYQAVDDFAHDDMTPIAAALGRRNERLHKRPFLVRQIARIAQPTSVIASAILARPHRRPPTNQAASL